MVRSAVGTDTFVVDVVAVAPGHVQQELPPALQQVARHRQAVVAGFQQHMQGVDRHEFVGFHSASPVAERTIRVLSRAQFIDQRGYRGVPARPDLTELRSSRKNDGRHGLTHDLLGARVGIIVEVAREAMRQRQRQ
jgi:hypothetical protein